MKKFFAFPYTGQSSQIIQNTLQKLDNDICNTFGNIDILQKRCFSKTKDIRSHFLRILTYWSRIPWCSNCHLSLVGETLQYLYPRQYYGIKVTKKKVQGRPQHKEITDGAALAQYVRDEEAIILILKTSCFKTDRINLSHTL